MSERGNTPGPAPRARSATVLESVDEIRERLGPRRTAPERIAAPGAAAAATPVHPPADTDASYDVTATFRPCGRPPMALLCIIDDGDDEGELVRVRTDAFVIGRTAGDLVIPHDPGISGRHAEIRRELKDGRYEWWLCDLKSTNGTFVRAASAVLVSRQELLIGSGRYRFEASAPAQSPEPAPPPSGPIESTRAWKAPVGAAVSVAGPCLVELTPQGEARRFRLQDGETWVGRDPRQCSVVLEDPLVSPRHARIERDARGRWTIRNARSLNGVWLRADEAPLGRGGQFRCGEQRFTIKVL